MNGSMLNIFQSIPNGSTGPLHKDREGTSASESNCTGFAAMLAGLIPADTPLDCANMVSPDGSDSEQTDRSGAGVFGKLISLSVGLPLVTICDAAATDGDATVVEGGSGQSAGKVTLLPVELAPDNAEAKGPDNVELARLFRSVNATLQSFTPHETEATSEVPVEMKTAYSLELKLGDRSITVPIVVNDLGDGNPSKLNIATDGRLTVNSVDPEAVSAKDLCATLEKIIPIDAQKSGNVRPEVAVRQVIMVADPQTFLKQYIRDLLPADDREISDVNDNGNSGKHETPVRILPSIASSKSMPVAQAVENDLNLNSDSDNNFANKLDLDKLVRMINGESEPVSKETSSLLHSNDVPQPTEMLVRSSEQSITVTNGAQPGTPTSQNIPAESIGFKVILPDAQMKIADMSTFRISIQPESLGQVRVHLAVIDDHLTARLSVESSAAKHLVEAHLQTLRATLQQHGIKVESFAVNVADRDNPNRQYDQKREPLSRKSKGALFSLDSYDRAEVPVVARRMSSGANLSGQLNLVA